MSIVKTRAMLEKSGCGLFVSIVCGIVIVVGFIAVTRGGRNSSGSEAGQTVMFSVGDVTVTGSLWELLVNGTARSEGGIERAPLQARPGMLAQELMKAVYAGYSLAAAKRMGIEIGDRQVASEPERQTEEIAAMAERQGVAVPPDELRKQILRDVSGKFAAIMADPNGGDYERGLAARHLIIEKLAKQLNPTDDELKHGSDEWMLRDIRISTAGAKEADVKQRTDKVLDEIKKEGFAKVADRYAGAQPNAPIQSAKVPMTKLRSQIDADPGLAAIKKLKVGETSAPIAGVDQTILINLVQIKENPPKDFEKQKGRLRASYVDEHVGEAFAKTMKDQQAVTKLDWKDKGFAVLYKWTQAMPTYEEQVAVAGKAADAVADSADGGRIATYVRYAADEAAWELATPKQKEALKADRAETFHAVLKFAEDYEARLNLADLDIDLKRGKDAIQDLTDAAEAVTGFTKDVEDHFTEIDKRVQKLVAEKLIQPADANGIKKAHDGWLKDKLQYDIDQKELAGKKAAEQADLAKQQKEFVENYKKAHGGKAPPPKVDTGQGLPTAPPTGK